jgi:hypothetical protein
MYARIGRTEDGTAGAAEVCTLRRLAGHDQQVLSLWPTAERAAADPTAEWYVVQDDRAGGARGERPVVAALVCFDGPMSEPREAASRRAGSERIGPLMDEHAGTVRSIVLWQPERRSKIVVMQTVSVEALEDAQREVLSSELLPGEDPALLPGPDRVDLYRVMSTAGVR